MQRSHRSRQGVCPHLGFVDGRRDGQAVRNILEALSYRDELPGRGAPEEVEAQAVSLSSEPLATTACRILLRAQIHARIDPLGSQGAGLAPALLSSRMCAQEASRCFVAKTPNTYFTVLCDSENVCF